MKNDSPYTELLKCIETKPHEIAKSIWRKYKILGENFENLNDLDKIKVYLKFAQEIELEGVHFKALIDNYISNENNHIDESEGDNDTSDDPWLISIP